MTVSTHKVTARIAVAGGAALTAAMFGMVASPAAHADGAAFDPSVLSGIPVTPTGPGLDLSVSYDGHSLVQVGDASSTAGTGSWAIAYGDGATADSNTLAYGDNAFAYGNDATAYAGYNTPGVGDGDTALALGTGSEAVAGGGNNDFAAALGNAVTALADGNNSYDIEPGDVTGAGGSGMAGAADAASTALASANPDDPAVFYYSADPTNIFSPVYTITPTGAEDVISTDGSGDIVGTQEFTVSYFGIPLDTFNGGVEYSPVSSPLDPFGSPYVEDVSTLGAAGSLIPDNTGFLTEEFGGGYGYLTDLANITGASPIASEYILTPFGPDNITTFVNEFLSFAGTATGASAVDPSSFVDLLSSIGL